MSNETKKQTKPAEEKPKQSRSGWRDVASTIGTITGAIILAIFIILFIFRSYQVDGPSMEKTLYNNDKLIIWKVPRTWAGITQHDYIPGRGDVIVFNEGGLGDQSEGKQLIKRVIGLPGERITIKNGKVTVYNQEHPRGFDPDTSLPYGENGAIPYTTGDMKVRLEPHQIFVLGDNRSESLDSRVFGPINADQIVGKLVMRYFPIGQAKAF